MKSYKIAVMPGDGTGPEVTVEAVEAILWLETDELPEGVVVGDVKVEAVEEVTESIPDYQGIDQGKLVPLLVASLQEALARITALEA